MALGEYAADSSHPSAPNGMRVSGAIDGDAWAAARGAPRSLMRRNSALHAAVGRGPLANRQLSTGVRGGYSPRLEGHVVAADLLHGEVVADDKRELPPILSVSPSPSQAQRMCSPLTKVPSRASRSITHKPRGVRTRWA